MSLMKKPMSCGTVSCLTISMASLMRLGCHASMGVMSWAACQSIWWSLMCECLTMADFSKSPLRPCARFEQHVLLFAIRLTGWNKHEGRNGALSSPFTSVDPGSNPARNRGRHVDWVFSPYLITWHAASIYYLVFFSHLNPKIFSSHVSYAYGLQRYRNF